MQNKEHYDGRWKNATLSDIIVDADHNTHQLHHKSSPNISFPNIIIPDSVFNPESTETAKQLHESHDLHANNAKLQNSINSCSSPTHLKPSYIDLLRNEIFCARILIMLITIFMLFICILFSISQILSLKLSNYWCDAVTLDDIKQHSIGNNLSEGDKGSCWRTKDSPVDHGMLWSSKSYGYQLNINTVSIIQFVIFILISLFLIILIIYDLTLFVKDVIKYKNKTLGKSEADEHIKTNIDKERKEVKETKKKNKCCKCCECCKFSKCYKCFKEYLVAYLKRFGNDTGFWCIKTMFKEIFEIFIQTQALFVYNGSDIYNKNNKNNLGYEPIYIILFSTILCTNCISCCIIWCCYAFKPTLCYGLVFEICLNSLDSFCDIFFAMFPLIIAWNYDNSSILTSLASLQNDSCITFAAAFFPMIFLLRKCWSLSQKSRVAMRRFYGNKFFIRRQSVTAVTDTQLRKSTKSTKSIEITEITESTESTECTEIVEPKKIRKQSSTPNLSRITSLTVSITKSWIITPKKSIFKMVSISIPALLFGVYGVIQLSLVLVHFSHSTKYCSAVQDELNNYYYDMNETDIDIDILNVIQNKPELILWDNCNYKIYPFDLYNGNNVCQCREFRINFNTNHLDRNYKLLWTENELELFFEINFVEIFTNVLSKWYMLQKFQWIHCNTNNKNCNNEKSTFNLTSNVFNGKNMNILNVGELSIDYIDEKISNWKHLEWIQMNDMLNVGEFPYDSMIELRELQYFAINPCRSRNFPDFLCSLKELKKVIIYYADKIESVPYCMTGLDNLEYFMLSAATNLLYLPLDIFKENVMPKLSVLDIGFSLSMTFDTLIHYNNITNITEFNDKFSYNKDITYWCDDAAFCNDMDNLQLISPPFYQFLNESGCCNRNVCKNNNGINYLCSQHLWQNGECNPSCNNTDCYFDGGDCLQLCQCIYDNYELLGNGECDINCNTTQCNYDGYDCVDITQFIDYELCENGFNENEHNCNISWINDGWCDNNCRNISQCGYDANDCKQENNDNHCNDNCKTTYSIFNLAANLQTKDNYISQSEICFDLIWSALKSEVEGIENINCTEWIKVSDINNDSLISFYEGLVSLHQKASISVEKALQIDCSQCVDGNYY